MRHKGEGGQDIYPGGSNSIPSSSYSLSWTKDEERRPCFLLSLELAPLPSFEHSHSSNFPFLSLFVFLVSMWQVETLPILANDKKSWSFSIVPHSFRTSLLKIL